MPSRSPSRSVQEQPSSGERCPTCARIEPAPPPFGGVHQRGSRRREGGLLQTAPGHEITAEEDHVPVPEPQGAPFPGEHRVLPLAVLAPELARAHEALNAV